ncbi:MAG: galactose mutarotase [Bacteroidales bacterium]|nr:galactose mutarotase [Bacteroidales bacterium]
MDRIYELRDKFSTNMDYNDSTINLFTLKNAHGLRATITNLGGRVVSLFVPDKDGQLRDVVLGFENVEDYLPENHRSDFGAAIGRYANRLNNGQITIDGKTYQLPQNDGKNCLHGGPDGWQYRIFNVEEVGDNRLVLSLVSEDGDSGFPGNVCVRVTYMLTDDNALDIQYEAVTDETTVINMTNHSYFNLNGDASTDILNHLLTIDADRYTPIGETFIPTGELASVEGTPMDFRQPKPIGRDISADFEQLRIGRGYDHNWVLNTKGDDSRPCARLDSPVTGIVLEVYTTEPGMQVYTGNFLDGTFVGKGGVVYHQRAAVCLETQKFPDSPNQHWPESDAILRPGEVYRSHTKFKFV